MHITTTVSAAVELRLEAIDGWVTVSTTYSVCSSQRESTDVYNYRAMLLMELNSVFSLIGQ